MLILPDHYSREVRDAFGRLQGNMNQMADDRSVPTYRTLMLRCWSEHDVLRGQWLWRFHVQWLDTEEGQSFPSLEALLDCLADTFASVEAG